MSRMGRNSLLLLIVAVLIVGFSVVVLAAEEGGEEEGGATDSTSTTIDSGLSPAVPMESEEAAPAEVDWTYRYMIPTGLVIAAVIILLTAIKYFTDVVRKRYRIVE
ncbi:MAG TPA: hypothetical protein VF148_16500 [Acidimicrobiia bacterium]